MRAIKLKLLLAFSLKPKEQKNKSEASSPTKKTNLETKFEDPPYVIRLEKTCSTAHIEYEIMPGKFKMYQVDVLCWQNAAKIYAPDGIKIFKTVSRNGLTFVPICIQHYLKELSIDDLIALRNAVIEFNVFTDKNKLGAAAKANKTEVIYIKETDVDRVDFVNGYTEKVNQSTDTSKSNQTRSDNDDAVSRATIYSKNEGCTKMTFQDDYAETIVLQDPYTGMEYKIKLTEEDYNRALVDELLEIIDYVCDETTPRSQIFFREFVKSCGPPEESKPQTKNEPTKPGAAGAKKPMREAKSPKIEKAPTKLTLQMQGEILFTDTNPIFQLENSRSEVNRLFVIPQVENLMTRFQKIQLNPIIIKVFAIKHFPEKLFENTGITNVYCKYVIPSIAECQTIVRPMGKTIKFYESHFFPTHTLSKIKLLEFLETRRLVVEVYGIQKNEPPKEPPKMFGEKPEDSKLSKIHSGVSCEERGENITKHILLAYCTYDLSSLLRNVWDFRAKEQLHVPESRLISGPLPKLTHNPTVDKHSGVFWAHYDICMNQINLAGLTLHDSKTSPLREWILMQNNTTLGLEAYLLSPQSAALVLHQVPNTFMRLLMIAFRKEVAERCLRNVLRHNQCEKITCESLEEDILTGFVIDNGNNFAIYVEGHSVGYILNFWQELDSFTNQDVKVFFNTDQTYEERLYPICTKWSGMCIIIMKIPLQNIYENQKIYVKGNLPILCQKALIKLNLMFLSNTMKTMFQNDLLPTLEELVSLDIEYGVPYAWKQFLECVISSETHQEGKTY